MATRTMTLSPWSDFAYLQHQLDRLTQEAFGARSQANVTTLPVDVFDTDEQLTIKAFVPGLRAEDLDIQVQENVLSINGQFPDLYDTNDAQHVTWYARELRGGRFGRSISLPYKVDWEGANATVADGILTLQLPKAAEAKPRRLEIRDGGEVTTHELSAVNTTSA